MSVTSDPFLRPAEPRPIRERWSFSDARLPVVAHASVVGVLLCTLITCLVLTAAPAAAQTTRRPSVHVCEDTLSDAYRDRVAIDLVYGDSNRRDMWLAIEIAGTQGRHCVVAKSARNAPDTSVYGVLEIRRLESNGYELATSLAGPRAPRQLCRNVRAATVAGDMPILWGVLLSLTVPKFIECLYDARAGRSL